MPVESKFYVTDLLIMAGKVLDYYAGFSVRSRRIKIFRKNKLQTKLSELKSV